MGDWVIMNETKIEIERRDLEQWIIDHITYANIIKYKEVKS